MAKRKSLSKKIRFEVFKRDSFTCQYCGQKSPDVILEVDHIKPVSKGGDNKIINLVTSCYDCNHGKFDRELSDDTVVKKQQRQLELIQEKREQLDLLYRWQKSLLDAEGMVTDKLAEYWSELLRGHYSLNQIGIKSVRELEKKFGLAMVMEAMKIATDNYLVTKDDSYTKESVELAFKRVGGICHVKSNPVDGEMYYIRKIITNRLGDYLKAEATVALKTAVKAGADLAELKEIACTVDNARDWRDIMYSRWRATF